MVPWYSSQNAASRAVAAEALRGRLAAEAKRRDDPLAARGRAVVGALKDIDASLQTTFKSLCPDGSGE